MRNDTLARKAAREKYRKSDKGKAAKKRYQQTENGKLIHNKSASKRYKNLPPIVYRWISPEGFTAYVGRGTMDRAIQHKRLSPWYKEGMKLRTLKARNEWHAMHLEGLWGELFQPRYNKEGYRK